MKTNFKVKNGRLMLNGKRYLEMNYTERTLFETFINYKKQQFFDLKVLRKKIGLCIFTVSILNQIL
jgi:hypothetical protein